MSYQSSGTMDDVPDPIGQDLDAYTLCREQLSLFLTDLKDKFEKQIGEVQ